MTSEPGRTTGQIVATIYTRIWDFFWTPIRWIAGMFFDHEWFPQYAVDHRRLYRTLAGKGIGRER